MQPTEYAGLKSRQTSVLLLSILVVALCGIAYQLIISTVSSYLLGNSVYQFSLTIGFFMFAMGVGSYLSKMMGDNLLFNFISVEIAISLVGGVCSLLLLLAFPFARALYETTMFSLIFIIGALVGMEIPILTGILTHKQGIRDSIANVMSLDYIGALIGALAFPLFLLPHLGLLRSSFAIGLINILTALINIWFFRHELKSPRIMAGVSLAVLGLLVTFTVYGTQLSSFAEKHLYFDQIIYQKQTQYQRIVVTQSTEREDTRLFIDGHIQFSSRDEYRYHESLVHPVMSVPGERSHVLVLGGGDGLAIREVLKYEEVQQIDLVDIDPEMTRISASLPMLVDMNQRSLEDARVNVYNDDAFSFINQPGVLYDRVIIDMPDPHNEAINKLYSKEFYTMIRKRMATGGVVVTQSSSPFFTRRTFWSIHETLDSVFNDTRGYQIGIPSFGVWGFNMASAGSSIPDRLAFTVDTRFINAEVMTAARVFGKDTQPLDVPVNSILEPRLYQLYLQDLDT